MRVYKFITIAMLFAVMALVTVCPVVGDWPNWRGPQHNGMS